MSDDLCPFTKEERRDEILEVLRVEVKEALDEYFTNSPFVIDAKQHYEDHKWTGKVRSDLGVVKTSFLRKLGQIVALLLVGGISWKYLGKYFFSGGQ